MTTQREIPTGIPLSVKVVKAIPDHPDALATRALLNAYSDKDGFHCPWCKKTITDLEEAIKHLAEELNQVFERYTKEVK